MPESLFVFIDSEFSPHSREWLSLGAVSGKRLFYAEATDGLLLQRAASEYESTPLKNQVLRQWGHSRVSPGGVASCAEMARAFEAWLAPIHGKQPQPVFICYDYSADIEYLEQGIAAAGRGWPPHWEPCNLAILNQDAVADAARERSWCDSEASLGLQRHHALADALALRAAYAAQSAD